MNKQTKIILFAFIYILAILAYYYDYITVAGLICVFCVSFLFLKQKIISFKYALVLLITFIIGLVNTALHLKFYDDLVSLSDKYAGITAEVCSIPANNLINKTKFYANVISYKIGKDKPVNVNAKILVTLSDDEAKLKNIKIGDTLNMEGKIKTVPYSQNPSQFDYAKYLQLKKVFTVFYVNKNWSIKSHSNTFLGKVLRKLNDTRTNIINIHAQNIKSPMLEVLGGIIFGDDAVNPDEETKTKFINSGIFHILAASGMNVTLIFGIWFFFAVKLKLNYRFSIITGIMLILFYTCMTGFGPPIIRATLMLTLILIGKLFDRTTSTISLLFLVGFIMLLFNPLMLFDIGFQLSFIVTFALILTAPLVSINTKYKLVNNILGACIIPVIAQIYAMPLQMYYFNTFTMYSVLTNITIIPVLSVVSFIGFISSIIALIPLLAVQVCKIADFILNPFLVYIVKTAEFFSSLPNSIIYLKKPSMLQIVLYFMIIIFITVIFENKLFKRKFYILISALLVLFGLTFISVHKNNTEIIFFSVGNADAIMLKTDTNKYFLIDTGKLPYMSTSSQAKNIIIKYLKDKGIKDIEALIVTHFDADHAGGTIDILNNLNVKHVYITDCSEDTKLYNDIENYLKLNKINTEIIGHDKRIFENENTIITLLKAQTKNISNENQKSIITHLKYKNNNVLFMADGDIETYNGLDDMYKKNLLLIKIGHHGANNTINSKMVNSAKFFVISTGQNIYGHPAYQTLEILKDKEYYRTDYNNAIKIVFDDKGYEKYFYSPRYKRFLYGFKY